MEAKKILNIFSERKKRTIKFFATHRTNKMKKAAITFLLLFLFSGSAVLAQTQYQGYFEFLQQIYFENSQHQYDSLLLDKMQSLQSQNLPAAEYRQVLWMLANLELNTGRPAGAFCHFFRLESLFPQNEFSGQNRRILDSLSIAFALPESFSDHLKQIPILPNPEEAFFNEISFLYTRNSESLRRELLLEIRDFLIRFPESRFADILLLWKGVLSEQQNAFYEAEVLYRMVLQLFPSSPIAGQVELNLGLLYLNHLNEVIKARDHFLNIVTNYSDKPISGEAQFALARIYDNKLKNPTEALIYYQTYHENFSDSSRVTYALLRMAEINDSLSKRENAAVWYEKLYEYIPNSTLALTALRRLESIYLKDLTNYKKAVRILLIEARVFHDPDKMKQAAEIYQTRLGKPEKAQSILKRMTELFPDRN